MYTYLNEYIHVYMSVCVFVYMCVYVSYKVWRANKTRA